MPDADDNEDYIARFRRIFPPRIPNPKRPVLDKPSDKLPMYNVERENLEED